jgi:formylglycine-generating enzyme required for sulfatase activity
MPVAGISAEDAATYLQWLRTTTRVPEARLCTEREWERAARGADDREFPHGNALAQDDANFDETYGRHPFGFGPDEVGAHPGSQSPFGVSDMAGNVWELVTSSLKQGEFALRGGAYYHSARTARSTNRLIVEPTTRLLQAGLRVCASPQFKAASDGLRRKDKEPCCAR